MGRRRAPRGRATRDAAGGRAPLGSAFRRAFAGGDDLEDVSVLATVASSVGLRGDELTTAIAARDVKDELRERTGAALALGVRGVPTLALDGRLLFGDDAMGKVVA